MDDEDGWAHWRRQWRLKEGTIYLNHGSFGPPPLMVRQARQQWQEQLDGQPMDFFVRHLEAAWCQARLRVAQLIGASQQAVALVENATYAMNVVAESFPLQASDQVLLTDHGYGSVRRIWQRACQRAGADTPIVAQLPQRIESSDQVVEAIFAAATSRTRLLIVSHVTSPTALILPVREICRRAQREGIAVCIDGPHAPAQVSIDVAALCCDFYTASCHKWLCAPFGSGFLYVAPRHQSLIRPLVLSWGRVPPRELQCWSDEFLWSGTRDPSALLTIPTAIDFFQQVGFGVFRQRTRALASYARQRLASLAAGTPIAADSAQWYGAMTHLPLPNGDCRSLQKQLWERFGIEVPIIDFHGQRTIRVSCHLYNSQRDIDLLYDALRQLL